MSSATDSIPAALEGAAFAPSSHADADPAAFEGAAFAPSSHADADKQARARHEAFQREGVELYDRLIRLSTMARNDLALSKEHFAWAVALLCVQLRETYPDADGKTAPKLFDALAADAAAYFDANSEPVVKK